MYVTPINNHQQYNIQINKNNYAKKHKTSSRSERSYFGYSYPVAAISFQAKLPQKLPTKLERFEGCLFGGAIGDAMGYPIEPLNIIDIKKLYGQSGKHYLKKYRGHYFFSDDTQMSLFTIKGLLNSFKYNRNLKEEPSYKIIYNAYQDWYKTQISTDFKENLNDLFSRKELFSRRGPGTTCLNSLKNKFMGTLNNPANNSATNGAAMRVAPIGLLYSDSPELAFKIGLKSGAMTHGNEGAYLPAGFLSCLIANITQGKNLERSIDDTLKILKEQPKHEYFVSLINKAKELAKSDIESPEAIEKIGQGFRGDEALAISIYSSLKHPNNFKNAITTSVNHSGDSDTTGAITGNIMGTLLGEKAIHRNWKENMELSDLLYKCSNELFNIKESGKNYINMINRQSQDTFSGKITKLHYTEEEIAKMKLMTPEEKEQYIWNKKKNL